VGNMDWIKKSNRSLKRYFLLYVIAPLVFLPGLETLFFVCYKITQSTYFETKNETEKRHFKFHDVPLKYETYLNQLKATSGKKIAVFGGSSAAGYASAISFTDFIKATKEDLIVHNYAEPGMAFSEFQSEILLRVMKYYDVLIVYAGHNEIWTTLYSKAKNHGQIVLPNGENIVADPVYKDLHERLRRVEYPGEVNTSSPSLSLNKPLQNVMLPWFLLRVSNKLKDLKEKLTLNEKKYPYFGDYTYLNEAESRVLIDRFRTTLLDIASKLDREQVLVVIPAFSNDLFPPIYQSYAPEKAKDVDTLEAVNSKAKTLYTTAKTRALDSGLLATIPPGSHRKYLHALSCSRLIRGKEIFLEKMLIECVNLFSDARNQDGIPFRSLDLLIGEKDFGGLKNSPKVLVREIKISQTLESLGVKSYLDLFVDFQHPSEIGHMVIANSILPLIFPDLKGNYQQSGPCAFRLSSDPSVEVALEPQRLKFATETNIGWLNRFIDRMPETELYEWYRLRASAKATECEIIK